MIVRPKASLYDILFAVRGSIAGRVAWRCLFITVLACVVVYTSDFHIEPLSRLGTAPFGLIGIAISVFMSFRNRRHTIVGGRDASSGTLNEHVMTETMTFIVGALSLLATPGPTNTLLATSGATSGFRKSLGLLLGELLGYLIAIAVLRAAVGPIIVAVPAFGGALSAVVCVYLLYLAWMLWRHSELQMAGAQPVTLQRVFVTTLLNPKAVIFAFTLLPSSVSAGEAGLLPWLSVLSFLIVMIGACWVAIGASLKWRIHETTGPQLGYRAGAVVLALLAGMIAWRAIGLA